MRALMILSGIVLWLSAFSCRQELWDALAVACQQFDVALHASDLSLLVQGMVAGVVTVLAASPTWKLVAGVLFMKFSLDMPSRRAGAASDPAAATPHGSVATTHHVGGDQPIPRTGSSRRTGPPWTSEA